MKIFSIYRKEPFREWHGIIAKNFAEAVAEVAPRELERNPRLEGWRVKSEKRLPAKLAASAKRTKKKATKKATKKRTAKKRTARRGKRGTAQARAYIDRKIPLLVREGRSTRQAAAIAYRQAREEYGEDAVPKQNPHGSKSYRRLSKLETRHEAHEKEARSELAKANAEQRKVSELAAAQLVAVREGRSTKGLAARQRKALARAKRHSREYRAHMRRAKVVLRQMGRKAS